MNYGYIYKTTCWLDGRVYIGQRRGDFKYKYLGSGKHLRLSIIKYGHENFSSELIQYGKNQQELDILEKCCIATAKNILGDEQVFNISEGGLKGIVMSGKNNPMFGTHRVGLKNPNWRGGVSRVKCYDCGKNISYGCKRCKSCVGKLRPRNKFIEMAKKRGAPWNKGLINPTQKLMESANA